MFKHQSLHTINVGADWPDILKLFERKREENCSDYSNWTIGISGNTLPVAKSMRDMIAGRASRYTTCLITCEEI
jgi:hypothetical protein